MAAIVIFWAIILGGVISLFNRASEFFVTEEVHITSAEEAEALLLLAARHFSNAFNGEPTEENVYRWLHEAVRFLDKEEG